MGCQDSAVSGRLIAKIEESLERHRFRWTLAL